MVSHKDEFHIVPPEIIIRRPMVLPHCKTCGNVRFSRKCSLPQEIEESDFFFDVNPAPITLFARVLANTAKMRPRVQQSSDLIRQLRQFLAH